MEVWTSRSVYKVLPNGKGDGFIAEKQEATVGATSNITVGERFEGKVLVVDLTTRTLRLDALFIPGIIAIKS